MSGTTFSTPLDVAWAGFVVYIDANGNGKLDLSGTNVETSDKVLGGADDLTLTFYAGGSSLDYEKLRDHSGILPHAGYNLSWSTESRWLDLDLVELKLARRRTLPQSVCGGMPTTSIGDRERWPDRGRRGRRQQRYGGFPPSGDPNLVCSSDGYSWQYTGYPTGYPTATCVPPTNPTTPPGLCFQYDEPTACAGGPTGGAIGPGDSVPPGWPCTLGVVCGTADGGRSPSPTRVIYPSRRLASVVLP